jgi:hypothetical protein
MGFNLEGVGENYMDGEYYEEDRDDFMNDWNDFFIILL